MALVFQKISEFLDTIDKLYITSFFVIHPCNPPKWSKNVTNMHPETPQNLTNSMLEKTMFWGIDYGMILTSKMIPKWPKIVQNDTLRLPRNPLGPLGGAMGPTRCPKTELWLQFGTPNATKTTPKSTKMPPLGSQEAPWGNHGSHQMPQNRF